jgi:cystathionine beta-lyase
MKWRTHPADVLPLWVAEMDVALAEPVARALHDAVSRSDTGYPAGTQYAAALLDFAVDRWKWSGVPISQTAIVPDVMMGVVEALRLVTSPGDAVVVNTPVYPPFFSFVEHLGRRIDEAPLTLANRIDLEALGEAFERATSHGQSAAYLLCNPHNPTGTVHTVDELKQVALLADRYGVRVVADEIHAPLVLAGAQFVPYLSIAGASRGLSLMSASKGWNLAGLKAALLLAGDDAAGDLALLPEEVSHGPSHLGIIAHTAALRDGGPWLDALLAGLDRKRTLLGGLLGEHLPTVPFSAPEATFMSWLDCTSLGFDDPGLTPGRGDVTAVTGPALVFLQEARVALSAGPAFGARGAGHVRLNYATSTAILTEAIERMGAVADSGAVPSTNDE